MSEINFPKDKMLQLHYISSLTSNRAYKKRKLFIQVAGLAIATYGEFTQRNYSGRTNIRKNYFGSS